MCSFLLSLTYFPFSNSPLEITQTFTKVIENKRSVINFDVFAKIFVSSLMLLTRNLKGAFSPWRNISLNLNLNKALFCYYVSVILLFKQGAKCGSCKPNLQVNEVKCCFRDNVFFNWKIKNECLKCFVFPFTKIPVLLNKMKSVNFLFSERVK